MRKIPTLYRRDPQDRRHVIVGDVTPGCEWVIAGEGVPTRKWDGTCVMLDEDGAWWARREVKPDRNPPPGWVEVDADPVTGKRVGWEPIAQSPFVKFWRDALTLPPDHASQWTPGTYELCGPRINGNPEGLDSHCLIRHGCPSWSVGDAADSDVAGLIDYCRRHWHEGIVWHHPDGRMAKLKVRDMSGGDSQ